MFAKIEFSIKSIANYVYKYSRFMVNQYYRSKVYVMLYEYDVHVTLVKREMFINQRC